MNRNDFVIIDPKSFYTATSQTEKNATVKDQKKREIRNAVSIVHGQSPPILLGLCNMRNNHFILLEANTKQRILFHYDSIKNETRQSSELKDLAAILNGDESFEQSAYTCVIGQSAQQSDTINCGVYAIYNFLCRLYGLQPCDKLNANQLVRIRCHVFVKLYDYQYLLSVVLKIRDEQPDLVDQAWLAAFTQHNDKRSVWEVEARRAVVILF